MAHSNNVPTVARNTVESESNPSGSVAISPDTPNPAGLLLASTNLVISLRKSERPPRSNPCGGKWRQSYGQASFQAVGNGKWVSSQSKVPLTLGFSAFRRARRVRRQIMTREEYDRLRLMVPAIAAQSKVSKVQVIEEAIKYIDQLHLALLQRLRSRTQSSSTPEGETPSIPTEPRQLRDLVHQMLSSRATNAFLSHLQRERSKRVPSFMEKADRMAKRRKH